MQGSAGVRDARARCTRHNRRGKCGPPDACGAAQRALPSEVASITRLPGAIRVSLPAQPFVPQPTERCLPATRTFRLTLMSHPEASNTGLQVATVRALKGETTVGVIKSGTVAIIGFNHVSATGITALQVDTINGCVHKTSGLVRCSVQHACALAVCRSSRMLARPSFPQSSILMAERTLPRQAFGGG